MVLLTEAGPKDTDTIIKFLTAMAGETKEFNYAPDIARQAVARSFSENVHWFLFYDDAGKALGACHVQSVHNYWRLEKRFYLGGFYIDPVYRGQGYFRAINEQLKAWAAAQGGVQLYIHVHEDNAKSIAVFSKAGFEEVGYRLYARHWGD